LSDLKLVDALDLLVNESIFSAQRGVPHYFVEHSDLFIVLNPVLVILMYNLEVSILTLHPLINLREVKDILSSILDHVLVQGSSLPKRIIFAHLVADHSLLGMSHVDVMLKQFRERNVVIFAIHELGSFLQSLLNDSMSDLRVKYEVTEDIKLVS
jgi:hypothetical protein